MNHAIEKIVDSLIQEINKKIKFVDIIILCEMVEMTEDEIIYYLNNKTDNVSIYLDIIEKIDYLIGRNVV